MANRAEVEEKQKIPLSTTKRSRKPKNHNSNSSDIKDEGNNKDNHTKRNHNNDKNRGPVTRQNGKRKTDDLKTCVSKKGKTQESAKKDPKKSKPQKSPVIRPTQINDHNASKIKTKSKPQNKSGIAKETNCQLKGLKHHNSAKSTSRHLNKTIELEHNDLQTTSLKRKAKKTDRNVQKKPGTVKKKRIVLNHLPNPELSQSLSINSSNQDLSFGNNITNIQQVITEMQSKIKNLEEKSVLDEQKIETFKKVLIEQRNNDIKTLLDEKENELLLRMDLLLLNFDPQRICRLCLLLVDNKENLTSLVEPPENQALILLVKNTTNIKVEIDDGLPSGICKECLQQLRNVDWIRRRAQRSNNLINKFVSLKKKNDCIAGSNLDGKQLLAEIFEVEDDDQEDQNDEFKIQDVFSLENSPSHLTVDVSNLKEEPQFDYEACKISLPGERSVFHVKHHPSNCKLCKTTFLNPWSLKSHYKYCRKSFQCSECLKCFWSMKLYIVHKRKRQFCVSTKKYRTCQECNVVFRWKWQLVFHVLQHTVYECRYCDKIMYSIDHLRHHVSYSHLASLY